MIRLFLLCMLCLLAYADTFSQSEAKEKTIAGKVLDESGAPLPYVNVYILNTFDGAATLDDGSFSLATRRGGKATLVASSIGYQKTNIEINLDADKFLEIRLKSDVVTTKDVVVAASSFGSDAEKGLVITSMDVMTTPGGAADIFQSLKTLPGLTQVSESAELYIRGGDPTETITLIDQVSMNHPYTYESSYGGLFSNVNSDMIKGMYFSSGGFSAKYGNALSGVLDLSSVDGNDSKQMEIGMSLASASLSGELPLNNNKIGLHVAARQNYTKPIYWFNDIGEKFTSSPISRDAGATMSYKFSETGKLKLLLLYADDQTGVKVDRTEYKGNFDGESTNMLSGVQVSDIFFSNLFMKTGISYSRYKNSWLLGLLDLDRTDDAYKARTDLEYRYSKSASLNFGAEVENRTASYLGIIPDEDWDIRPEGASIIIDAAVTTTRYGAYAEWEVKELFGTNRLFIVPGVRFDYVDELNVNWVDPRVNFGWRIDDKTTLKLGTGIFHQSGDPRLYNKDDGNPKLKEFRAIHYIAGLDYNPDNNTSIRVEAYYKDYDNLPLEDDVLNYTNGGYGLARGVDIMAKGNLLGIDGWISYGFINTKRKWMDFEDYSSGDYDITHNFTLVAKYNLSQSFQIGINYKYATGRPYTPPVSSNYIEEAGIYEPVYGKDNSV
ncbi:MAG TPA: TonB-dependent receptor, partial [Ignavibacteriales bacterium]|nr:TonB-dependent receptor [Ignavibacteriales bacterium]